MDGHYSGSWGMESVPDQPPQSPFPIYDPQVLTSVCGDNAEVIGLLLRRFEQMLDRDLRALEAAIICQNIVEVRHQTHRLLGAAVSVGAADFAASVRRIAALVRGKDWELMAAELPQVRRSDARLRERLKQS